MRVGGGAIDEEEVDSEGGIVAEVVVGISPSGCFFPSGSSFSPVGLEPGFGSSASSSSSSSSSSDELLSSSSESSGSRGGGGRGAIMALSSPGAFRVGREGRLSVVARRRCEQKVQW